VEPIHVHGLVFALLICFGIFLGLLDHQVRLLGEWLQVQHDWLEKLQNRIYDLEKK